MPTLFHELIGQNLCFYSLQLKNPQDYRYARDFATELEVTNDCVERGVKLIGDFKDYTEDEEQRQFLLQVVEDHRKNHRSMTKKN